MQKAFSFDSDTIKKTLKGALIAATGGAAIALLNYIGTIDVANPAVTALIAWFVPTAVNGVREFIKGV